MHYLLAIVSNPDLNFRVSKLSIRIFFSSHSNIELLKQINLRVFKNSWRKLLINSFGKSDD